MGNFSLLFTTYNILMSFIPGSCFDTVKIGDEALGLSGYISFFGGVSAGGLSIETL